MKRISIFMLLWAVVGASVASSWETSSIRTVKGGLVRVGMPAQEALHELGPNAQRSKGKSSQQGEVWTWRGEDGVYHISIAKGRVTKIVVTPNRD